MRIVSLFFSTDNTLSMIDVWLLKVGELHIRMHVEWHKADKEHGHSVAFVDVPYTKQSDVIPAIKQLLTVKPEDQYIKEAQSMLKKLYGDIK